MPELSIHHHCNPLINFIQTITIIVISAHVIGIMTVMQYFQSGDPPGPPTSPLQLTPVLVESQIARIAETAATLVKSLPDLEPKQPNIKKKICKELEVSSPIW